jgi:hypothetical protein
LHNYFLIRITCLCCLLCLSACDRLPESYPPPQQRHPIPGLNLGPDAMMVQIGPPAADPFIVKDIYGSANISWRWTRKDPTVRIPVLAADDMRFSTDFAIWDQGFKSTGPLTISFLVNGRLLDKVRYTTPGEKHFEKPVPPDWLAGQHEVTAGLSIDKLYTAPDSGAKFGVILVRLGLKP